MGFMKDRHSEDKGAAGEDEETKQKMGPFIDPLEHAALLKGKCAACMAELSPEDEKAFGHAAFFGSNNFVSKA